MELGEWGVSVFASVCSISASPGPCQGLPPAREVTGLAPRLSFSCRNGWRMCGMKQQTFAFRWSWNPEYRREIPAWLFLMTTVFLVCGCLPPHCAPSPSQGGSKQALSIRSHKEAGSSWRLISITSSEPNHLSKVLSKCLHTRDEGVAYSAAFWIFLWEPSASWVSSQHSAQDVVCFFQAYSTLSAFCSEGLSIRITRY